MPEYKLLSDAILDGARLRPQAHYSYCDPRGRTCALGAANHAITGIAENGICGLVSNESLCRILNELATCPVPDCAHLKKDRQYPLEAIIPHLNDTHAWTREQIAGFVTTIEERLGLVEIISTVEVDVTHNDIEQGVKGDCHHCPIALALRRHFPSAPSLYVLYMASYIKPSETENFLVGKLPDKAERFVKDYDAGKSRRPFRFELSLKGA
jgi:hypothetical protein